MTEEQKYKRSLRRKRVLFSFVLVLGFLVHLVGFTYLKLRRNPDTGDIFKRPFVHFDGVNQDASNQVVQERSMLFDSAPLFLPTRWNTAGVYEQPDLSKVQTPLFYLYSEQITLSEDTLSPESSYVALRDEGLDSQLTEADFSSLKHFGEQDVEKRVYAKGVPYRVWDFYTGKMVFEGDLPPEIGLEGNVERPEFSEWILLVTVYGVTGEPYRVKGNSVPRRDVAIRNWLMKAPFIKAYQSGYFRVVIGS
jgi:hypothetical protein